MDTPSPSHTHTPNYYICIDFGTSNTVISYIENDIIKQIPNDFTGDILIPSTLYINTETIDPDTPISQFEYNIHYSISSEATQTVKTNGDYENYYCEFKRCLGITSKTIDTYKDFLNRYPHQWEAIDDMIYVVLSDRKISICEIITLYFIGLKHMIYGKLNIGHETRTHIYITCPAYFFELQRNQLKRAVESAGFHVVKLLNEPTAGAIYHIHSLHSLHSTHNVNSTCTEQTQPSNKYIIYDLGGGTIDTTVVEHNSVDNIYEVIDIDGNNNLGGIDIDNILIHDIFQKYSIDRKPKTVNMVKQCAQEIKIGLSNNTVHTVCLERVPVHGKIVPKLEIRYLRQTFGNLINDVIEQMICPIKTMCEKYNTTNIVFIGGPTQIPLLQSKVSAFVSTMDNTTQILNSDNLHLYKSIVSMGGSFYYKKSFEKSNICLLDIIPMNIGFKGIDDQMVVMISKGSSVPSQIEKIFTTSYDCQRTIDIDVYEGLDDLYASANTFIGSYKIIGLPPVPSGMILVKLLFKITSNGLLEMSINGSRNRSDSNDKSFEFKFNENIRLVPQSVVKSMLKKLLLTKVGSNQCPK